MGASDVVGGVLEDGEVEGKGAVPDVGREHGRADACRRRVGWWAGGDAGEDAVLVGFAEGAVAGVEVFGGLLDGEDADAGWEGAVEGAMEVGGGDGAASEKVATWARAWTPVSVRPEPWGRTVSPVMRWMAWASVPCMVGRLGWICQPL